MQLHFIGPFKVMKVGDCNKDYVYNFAFENPIGHVLLGTLIRIKFNRFWQYQVMSSPGF